ncbi:MAG: ABC transporter ATP-binding protein [Rhodospirillales bacterium]|nr:ABC transporter ATP-binding protein [Rhodospirillales bacterium]
MVIPHSLEPALKLQDVHLQLASDAGQVHILRGINLEIARGETVGVVGPSGSGKTSLLMIAAGLENTTSGSVSSCGTLFNGLDEDGLAAFRRDHIGIVFQNFHLVPSMTALENVALPLEFAGKSKAFERARSELESVGLGQRVDHYPGQLSGGEQQRVALARAFVTEPALLLADEPTGSLDQATGEQVMEMLFDLRDRYGTTLILVTHAPELANKCARLIKLADGQVVSDAAPTAAKPAPQIDE